MKSFILTVIFNLGILRLHMFQQTTETMIDSHNSKWDWSFQLYSVLCYLSLAMLWKIYFTYLLKIENVSDKFLYLVKYTFFMFLEHSSFGYKIITLLEFYAQKYTGI